MAQGFSDKPKGLPGQMDIFGNDDARAADFLGTPATLVHQLLHAVPDLFGQVAVEPCAGNGSMIRHTAFFAQAMAQSPIEWMYAIEIRDEMADLLDSGVSGEIFSPQDVTTIESDSVYSEIPTLALTNFPWYDGVIPICRAVWRLWPNAHIWGLCSTYFYMQADKEPRATFMREHRPEDILHVPNRVCFEGHTKKYNTPVAWHHFLPRGERGAGHWDMLESVTP